MERCDCDTCEREIQQVEGNPTIVLAFEWRREWVPTPDKPSRLESAARNACRMHIADPRHARRLTALRTKNLYQLGNHL